VERIESDNFGYAVSMHENTIVVGVPFKKSAPGLNASIYGAAYVFEFANGQWTQRVQLLSPSPNRIGSDFGSSVQLSDNLLVIGAPREHGPAGFNQGAVYLARKSGASWSALRQIYAQDAAGADFFGVSVAVDGLAQRLIVGAPFDDTPVVNAGSAYGWIVQ
jgi:hypothetical protein